ncbi:MAG: iron transporter permease [Pseudarthrobacter sp.]|nr:iron transporter permease [Pseudarthrobacter sp.]
MPSLNDFRIKPHPRPASPAAGAGAATAAPAAPDGLGWLRLGVWLALALLILLPLATVVNLGILPENLAVIASADVVEAAANSVLSALGSAVLATIAGALLALLLDRTNVPGRAALRWFFLLPFLVPPFIGAMAWMALLAPNGPVNSGLRHLAGPDSPALSVFGGWGVVLLLSIHSYPLAYLIIRAALRRVPRNLEEAARIGGAGASRTLADITLALMRPGLLAAFVLTFIANMSDFGIPALIGLPERYTTLTTLVYRYLASGTVTNPLPAVAAIGLVLLVLAVVAILAQRRLAQRTELQGGTEPLAPLDLGVARFWISGALWAVALAVCIMPLLALTAQALLPAPGVPLTWDNISLKNFQAAISSRGTRQGIANSLGLAAGAAAICGILGLVIAALLTRTRGRTNTAMDVTVMLPQALPGLVLAVAWLLIAPALGIFNTPWVILGAYVMAFLALAVQAVRAPLQSVPASLEEAGRISGASALRALADIALRIAAPAAFTGAVVVLLTAVRELTISILLVAPGNQTLGVVIFNLQQAGDYNAASALALVVTLAGILGLTLTARITGTPKRTPARRRTKWLE